MQLSRARPEPTFHPAAPRTYLNRPPTVCLRGNPGRDAPTRSLALRPKKLHEFRESRPRRHARTATARSPAYFMNERMNEWRPRFCQRECGARAPGMDGRRARRGARSFIIGRPYAAVEGRQKSGLTVLCYLTEDGAQWSKTEGPTDADRIRLNEGCSRWKRNFVHVGTETVNGMF